MQEPDKVPASRIATVVTAAIVIGATAVIAATYGGGVNGALPPRAFSSVRPQGTIDTALLGGDGGTGDEARARLQAVLNGYGWVDRDAGVAHIPIDRAMDLVLSEAR